MDWTPIVIAAVGVATPVVGAVLGATWHLSSKLTGLKTKVDDMDRRLGLLEGVRDTIAMVPSALERIRNLESVVFRAVTFGAKE